MNEDRTRKRSHKEGITNIGDLSNIFRCSRCKDLASIEKRCEYIVAVCRCGYKWVIKEVDGEH